MTEGMQTLRKVLCLPHTKRTQLLLGAGYRQGQLCICALSKWFFMMIRSIDNRGTDRFGSASSLAIKEENLIFCASSFACCWLECMHSKWMKEIYKNRYIFLFCCTFYPRKEVLRDILFRSRRIWELGFLTFK